jgi:hypothetical protein
LKIVLPSTVIGVISPSFCINDNHSIATIMTNAACRTGQKVTFDDVNQEVMVNGKPFKY